MPTNQEALAALRRISDLQNLVKSHTAPTSTIGRPGPKDRPMPAEGELLSRARTFPDLIDSTPLGLLGSLANPSEVVDASGPIGGLKRASELAYSHVKGVPGLYSRLTDAITQLPEKVHPVKAMSQAKNMASQEEISYRGLDKFLGGKGNEMIRRDEILSHLGQNPIRLSQSHYGGPTPNYTQEDLAREYYRQYGAPLADDFGEVGQESMQPVYDRLSLGYRTPKYSDYQVQPYGKNYGEDLIKLENKPMGSTSEEAIDYIVNPPPVYQDPEWPGEDNLINWIRYDEKVLPGKGPAPSDLLSDRTPEEYLTSGDRGSKGLFMQESQSNLHQAGRRGGYMKPIDSVVEAKARELQDEISSIDEELDYIANQRESVPFASPEWHSAQDRFVELGTRQSQISQELENITQTMRGGAVPDLPFKSSQGPYSQAQWEAKGNTGTPPQFKPSAQDHTDLGFKQQILKAAADPKIEWLGLNSGEGVLSMGMGAPERGTKAHYDKIYVDKLAKLLKPFGVKLERAELPGPGNVDDIILGASRELPTGNPSLFKAYKPIYAENAGGLSEQIASTIPSSYEISEESMEPIMGALRSRFIKNKEHLPGLPFTKATLTPQIKAAILERGFPAMALLGLLEAGRSHEKTQR